MLNSPFGDFFFHLTFSCSSVTHVSDSQDIQHNLMRSPTAPLVVVQLFSVTVLLRTVLPCPAFKILNRHPCSLSTTNKGFFSFFFLASLDSVQMCAVCSHISAVLQKGGLKSLHLHYDRRWRRRGRVMTRASIQPRQLLQATVRRNKKVMAPP